MFIGSINATLRSHFKRIVSTFSGRSVVVGCSGNFTFEAILSQHGRPAAIHSNDVSLYSCLAGAHFTGDDLPLALCDPDFDWIEPYLRREPAEKLACVMVLLDMAPWFKRDNPHRVRMYDIYRAEFARLVAETAERVRAVPMALTSFFPGDVGEHYARHLDDANAVFCSFAPTYRGGYERMYSKVDAIFDWPRPTYAVLDDEGRDRLLRTIGQRDFVWYDDRPDLDPRLVVRHHRAGARTVFLYSNMLEPALFRDHRKLVDPKRRMADRDTVLGPEGRVAVRRMAVAELTAYKEMFLSKRIDHSSGSWAFEISVDGRVVGFMEFATSQIATRDTCYIKSDFVVPGTAYPRLSKLPIMLAKSGEMRAVLERIQELRKRTVFTLVFTDKAVSMKYRGVFRLARRGVSQSGQKGQPYLLYESTFTRDSFQETYRQWTAKYGKRSASSIAS